MGSVWEVCEVSEVLSEIYRKYYKCKGSILEEYGKYEKYMGSIGSVKKIGRFMGSM